MNSPRITQDSRRHRSRGPAARGAFLHGPGVFLRSNFISNPESLFHFASGLSPFLPTGGTPGMDRGTGAKPHLFPIKDISRRRGHLFPGSTPCARGSTPSACLSKDVLFPTKDISFPTKVFSFLTKVFSFLTKVFSFLTKVFSFLTKDIFSRDYSLFVSD